MFLKRILLLIFICSYLNAKEKITLYPDWLDQFQFAGYYIAKEKGFYDDFGLDLADLSAAVDHAYKHGTAIFDFDEIAEEDIGEESCYG